MMALRTTLMDEQNFAIRKYSCVNTELAEYDPIPLSPESKLVYKQWKMDEKDELLIDGYYRECYIRSHPFLPNDVREIIISYYFKKYSKEKLNIKISAMQRAMQLQKKEKMRNILRYILIFIEFIGISGLILSPDIAAIIIVNMNNCNNLAMDGDGSNDMTINDYLWSGSIIHIIFVVLIYGIGMLCEHCIDSSDIESKNCLWIWFWLCAFFWVPWTIEGAILYSKMDQTAPSNQQCSDMMISWIVIKLALYGFTPLLLCCAAFVCYIIKSM